jgi:molybdate transport system ATP-binding protein
MADQLICQCRKRLSKSFEVEADLRIPLDRAPVTVLFGPSGAGKTTLLRMIAGLEQPDAGSIVFGERTWFDAARAIHLPPQERRAGFLFQDYALFPHLTVAENVSYAASRESAGKLLDRFGLGELAGRKPRAISGGQQQRVALARALAAQPTLLLLDEPLSALDASSRSRTRYELRRMLLSSGVPSIIVTHDRMEAVALGDWMAVIVEGRIRQTGPVQEVFRRPADLQVAESVGVENVLAAEIAGRESGLLILKVGSARIQCVDSGETGPVSACIRADRKSVV